MRKQWVAIAVGLVLAGASAATATDWTWLFPLLGSPPVGNPADTTAYKVPGSTRSFSDVQIHDLKHVVDWFPGDHPAMPAIVAAGHGAANACGYCHLATGDGRPENSALAGLPADYIRRQVIAFADGHRTSPLATAVPGKMMTTTVKAVSPEEVAAAADYFSKLPYTSHVRVVETPELSFRVARFVYLLAPGPRQPIGDRIIEVPLDPDGFERRDPRTRYAAFVPPGSIAAGRAVTASGGGARQPCAMCHGEGLRGGIAPPLAGRSPTGIVRQLLSFKVGSRSDAEAAPMRAIAQQLTDRDMVAVAAYAATLKP